MRGFRPNPLDRVLMSEKTHLYHLSETKRSHEISARKVGSQPCVARLGTYLSLLPARTAHCLESILHIVTSLSLAPTPNWLAAKFRLHTFSCMVLLYA